MGYQGKVEAQRQARELRAQGRTLADIAAELGVSKSSVSCWVRDVAYPLSPRAARGARRPHPLREAKLREIERLDSEGLARLGHLDDQAYLAAGVALYAGEGAKGEGAVKFANSDPAMIAFFCRWLRHFFAVDESRLRVCVYLHEGLDLGTAERHWAQVTRIPRSQFTRAYRPPVRSSFRTVKHPNGCAYVRYSCSRTHRSIMGLVRALLSSSGSTSQSGVAQLAEQPAVNR